MKKLIVFDGMDGAGKGEMISRLSSFLKDKGFDVMVTKEPTDGIYGKKAREILKDEKDPRSNALRCLELFVKDREEHVKEMLAFDGIVICDRYYYSTIAFQHTQGISLKKVIAANIPFKKPDIAFILDLPVEVAIERIRKRGIPEEKFEEISFMKELRKNFLRLRYELDDLIVIIDASKSIDEVFSQIKEEVQGLVSTLS